MSARLSKLLAISTPSPAGQLLQSGSPACSSLSAAAPTFYSPALSLSIALPLSLSLSLSDKSRRSFIIAKSLPFFLIFAALYLVALVLSLLRWITGTQH
ncbi:hypothetical protein ACTXT7_011321 [Hymenolepis weldensis]